MDQRRLRLGDILDDYCPRERRVTNHAVVAMIEVEVRQTRCTTCDAEHVYKGARIPKRRKKEAPAALYREVLAGMPDHDVDANLAAPVTESVGEEAAPSAESIEVAPNHSEETGVSADDESDRPELPLPSPAEDGPVHRQLLRAKLPRPEGQKDTRPVPEFTGRQSAGRNNGSFRDRSRMRTAGDPRSMMGRGNGGAPNGNRAQGGGRFQGRPGQHRNPGGRGGSQSGFRGGQPRHGGKKGRG